VFEAGAIFTGVLLVSLIAFSGQVNNPLSRYVRFLLYPSALWAAYRFGAPGAINAVFTVSCVAIWGTLLASARSRWPIQTSALFLQAYLGAFAVTNLVSARIRTPARGKSCNK
jgi:integral membrane sensor domain MASE1